MTENNAKIHVQADETLGGIKREYVEVDREAEIGDKVICLDDTGGDLTIGGIYTIDEIIEDDGIGYGFIDDAGAERAFWLESKYRVLEPTDIVRIGTQRCKLTDRKAEVGEKVIYMYEGKSDGIVREVRDVRCDRVRVCKFMDEFGVWVDGFYHGIYRVLVPAEAEADEPQPADLIDVVSNLAEEVSKLKRKVSGLLTTIERHEDEIDTLHKDNRTLGEELARLKEPKDNKINYEDAALVFIQRKVAGSVEVYQDGKRLRGVISVNINAKVGELTTHTIEFGTGHTAGERP